METVWIVLLLWWGPVTSVPLADVSILAPWLWDTKHCNPADIELCQVWEDVMKPMRWGLCKVWMGQKDALFVARPGGSSPVWRIFPAPDTCSGTRPHIPSPAAQPSPAQPSPAQPGRGCGHEISSFPVPSLPFPPPAPAPASSTPPPLEMVWWQAWGSCLVLISCQSDNSDVNISTSCKTDFSLHYSNLDHFLNTSDGSDYRIAQLSTIASITGLIFTFTNQSRARRWGM